MSAEKVQNNADKSEDASKKRAEKIDSSERLSESIGSQVDSSKFSSATVKESVSLPMLDLIDSSLKKIIESSEQAQSTSSKPSLKKSIDGVQEFQDGKGGVWTSSDGARWIRTGSEERDSFFASIKFAANGSLLRFDKTYGLSTTYAVDGSQTRAFTSNDGKNHSLTKFADGKQRWNDGSKTWNSVDGLIWTSGKEKLERQIQIDDFGRLKVRNSDSSSDRIRAVSAQTAEINKQMWRMELQYNIKFALPGERVKTMDGSPAEPSSDKDNTCSLEQKDLLPGLADDKKVDMRLPSIEEIRVLEKTLKAFSHIADKQSNGRLDFGGLKFGFVSAEGHGAKVTEYGWYSGDKPSIYFGPRIKTTTVGLDAFEGTAYHEMAHHVQNVTWKTDENEHDIPPQALLDFFGYEKTPQSDPKAEPEYRMRDKDGNLWQFKELKIDCKEKAIWLPVLDGQMSHDLSLGLSNAKFRMLLPEEKRPSTNYFFHPQEAHAEALAMLIQNPKMLWQTNPDLYRELKKWDQADIDAKFKTRKEANGQVVPNRIRAMDGSIVPNTRANSSAIRMQEQQ